MTYTVSLHNTTPQAAGRALAVCVKTRQDAKQYLNDVNDSAHYSAKVLCALGAETFALSEAEARSIYREWVNEA